MMKNDFFISIINQSNGAEREIYFLNNHHHHHQVVRLKGGEDLLLWRGPSLYNSNRILLTVVNQ